MRQEQASPSLTGNVDEAMSAAEDSPRTNGGTLTSEAIRIIRRAIVTLEVGPGTHIDERFVTEKFKLGRTPTREALRQIETDGLVEIHSNRGAIVAGLDLEYVKEFFNANLVAERMICHFVNFRASGLPDRLGELQRNHGTAAEKGVLSEILDANRKFHNCLIDATENRFIVAYCRKLALHDERINHWVYSRDSELELGRREYLRLSVGEHAQMVEAVESDDRERLSMISVGHVRRTQDLMLKLLSADSLQGFCMP